MWGAYRRAEGARSARAVVIGLVTSVAAVLGGAAFALVDISAASAVPSGRPGVAPQVPATPTDDSDQHTASNSPQLAIDPTEPRFVVIANRIDAPFSCSLQVSGDGGRGWITVSPIRTLPKGADTCYAPEVAFADDGTLYYLFVGLHGAGNSPMGAFLMTSTNRARTFSAPRPVLGAERYQVRMALDSTMGPSGRLHLVWLQAGATPPTGGLPPTPNPILTKYSDDGGTTFSEPVQISDPHRARAVAPAVALGPAHSMTVVYYDLGEDSRDYQGLEGPAWTESRWSLVATHSADGVHFDSGRVVDADIAPPGRVMLIYTMPPASVVSDADGRLFVAWHDARNTDWDVFVRRSTDGGATWSSPVRVNDDRLHDGFHQYLPRLAVSPSGRVDIVFYDRRNGDNIGVDVYYAYSADHGESFSSNYRVSRNTFSSVVGPRYAVPSAKGLFEFGSRIALVSLDQRALAAWTDTSNDRPGIKSQDIMAAEINFPSSPGVPAWRRISGFAVVGGGLAGLWLILRPLLRAWRARPESGEAAVGEG